MRTTILSFSLLFCSLITFSQNDSNCACCTEEHGAFDFWVGQWTVIKPDGSPAGKNIIEKIQDDCVLMENWTSASPGYTGTSYNFYNGQTKKWEQLWIDNQGQSLHMTGGRTGDKMIMKTDWLVAANGNRYYHQISWTLNTDGTVRQLWETFPEGQPTQIAFDGLYKKEE
ncbi:MAG: hypothetical protein KJO49_01815 [Bacteroidia bacterium]|nr:hypothetical protein [Bacteroidia bacterium]NNK70711.1 hypothetical protein [Flavobacteriaceae bacterium]NNL80045.1 hypothetical protein [Flavobacteriaceae bacterium]